MDFALDIAEFALHAVIIVVGLLIVVAFIASLISKNKDSSEIKITNLNKKFQKNRLSLLKKQLNKKDLKSAMKDLKKSSKDFEEKPCAYVLEFEGDIKASATEHLREEISTLLQVAKAGDSVILKLESPGGMVHGYGLAASQLSRITDANLKLTVCVDKIAASGGYMMACIADKIISAPFAIIGSIGVVAAMPNFHKVLKKNEIEYLEITAGEFKRTLTPLGEITEQGMSKFKEQIEQVHDLFKEHVIAKRPQIELRQVATGEYWYGQQALTLNLVDELGTSDEHLLKLSKDHRLFAIKHEGKKTLKEKINEGLNEQMEGLYTKVIDNLWKQRFQ